MNLVLDRIKQQTLQSNPVKAEIQEETKVVAPRPTVKAISPIQLKEIFMNELTEPKPAPTGDMVFGGIQDFVEWYLLKKDCFAPEQNTPLSTLIQARDIIEIGCGCKRANRIRQANDYFKTFWLNNQTTDLPKKVLQVGNFSSVSFSIDGFPFLKVDASTL